MHQKVIDQIFLRFSKQIAHPKSELYYTNHFTLFVAVILSCQSTDRMVNKITYKLFKLADTPYKMILLGELKLKNYIRTIGLYNMKAKNIINACQIMFDKFNNQLPDNFEKLIKLPGVGQKSANVLLNTLFHQPTIAVDTHVYRVSNRIGLCVTNSASQTHISLKDKIHYRWKQYAHNWLVLHGRYICKARKPLCQKCIIYDLCQFQDKTFLKNKEQIKM